MHPTFVAKLKPKKLLDGIFAEKIVGAQPARDGQQRQSAGRHRYVRRCHGKRHQSPGACNRQPISLLPSRKNPLKRARRQAPHSRAHGPGWANSSVFVALMPRHQRRRAKRRLRRPNRPSKPSRRHQHRNLRKSSSANRSHRLPRHKLRRLHRRPPRLRRPASSMALPRPYPGRFQPPRGRGPLSRALELLNRAPWIASSTSSPAPTTSAH